MAKFTFMIEEILRRSVTVEADDVGTARGMVNKQYETEQIVLSADDFYGYGIHLQSVDYGTDNQD